MRARRVTDILFVLSLLCAFAVLGLFVVVLGADVYIGIAGGMKANYDVRASMSYLTEKIRQNDVEGGVSIRAFDQGEALVLTQSVEGAAYETWVYVGEGNLMEATVPAGPQVSPGSGQAIMELSQASFTPLGDNLIRIVTADGEGNRVEGAAYVRSGIA